MSEQADSFVAVFDKVFAADFCSELIAGFRASQAQVAGKIGGGVDAQIKSSTDLALSQAPELLAYDKKLKAGIWGCMLHYFHRHPHMLAGSILARVDDGQHSTLLTADLVAGMTMAQRNQIAQRAYKLSPIQLQHYAQGQGHFQLWHSENYLRAGNIEPLRRALFFLVYLNTVQEGGETEFFYQRQAIAPVAGRVLIAPAGFTHTHRGSVPISNDKIIAAGWLHFRDVAETGTDTPTRA